MGIEELRKLIFGETANLEHRKADFPADWFDIKERLAGMKENFLTGTIIRKSAGAWVNRMPRLSGT